MIGENYYIEPKAKDHIQRFKGVGKNTPIPASPNYTKGEPSNITKAKEQELSKDESYKAMVLRGLNYNLDAEYINIKIEEKLEEVSKSLKEELKEEILKELREEFNAKFEEMKKEYDTRYDFNLSDDDHMDIAGHGQKPE